MQKFHQILVLIVVFAFFSRAQAADYKEEENVLILGDSSLDSALNEFEFLLVEFYAPWCGHCQHLAPEYAAAASKLKEQGLSVRLAKVDCTVETETASKYEIQGYPTLKFFANGRPTEYEGGRTEKDIINWLKKKTGPSTSEATSLKELAKITQENELVILFVGGKEDAGFSSFEALSKSTDNVAFVYSSNEEVKSQQAAAEGTKVIFLKNADEARKDFDGELTEDSLLEFVNQNRFPLVLPFGQGAAEMIFEQSITSFVLLYAKSADNEKVRSAFKDAAKKLNGKILFTESDIEDEELGPKFAEYLGIASSDVPAIRILVPRGDAAPQKFKLESDISFENLLAFYEDFTNDKLKMFLKSDPIPESNDENVKIVVAKSFESIVEDPEKDVFVEFYAPWCGHCQQLSPVWDDVADTLKEVKNLVIAKMDATSNEVDAVEISGFPTLMFYPKGDKKNPIPYEGERTKNSILSFLKKNSVDVDSAFADEL